MALAVRSMWDPFGSVVRQLDTDFDSLVRRAFNGTGQPAGFVPAADVVRDGSDVVVTLELPGVDIESDVSVEVSDGRLLVTGQRTENAERTEQDESGQDAVIVRESRSGSFRREFALPEHVTADDVAADYDRGLLRIRVSNVAKPKIEPRRIPVRALGAARTPAEVSGEQSS